MPSLLKAEGITRSYRVGESDLEVLKGVDLSVSLGEVVAVVGPSGVGKSTLLHILGGLDRPSSGRLSIDETDVFSLSDSDRAQFRNEAIGFVFQFHHLLSDFTALENVMLPLMIQGRARCDAGEAASELLQKVGLSERQDHLPSELSGGESQRVAVVRALVTRPKLVLADEPSGNLDVERSAELHDLIWNLATEFQQTFVIATHDLALAKRADRVIRMSEGWIVEDLN
ncbi:MAG TPA: lipoprotein-releasing system ATP-binding protein LolD [Candidatus Latescibacteria bacterium]|nr:lipoprotein-releasing system ATP-binding protein LolD [Candidatus Latescibacterota bacterium]|tara:strand:- start:1396 stop:2079 length:684 start_codon:yes stop_codon:yes gene_type:complete